MPLVPSFQLRLKDQIYEGLSTVGRYDGKRPTLTAATAGGRVLMYDPYAPEENGESVRYLNINKKITAVSSGALDPTVDRDVLLVGTATDLLAYDVDENKDLFHKDVQEGVGAMTCGRMSPLDAPTAIVGGNGSVQGFDAEGEEVFWTVAGDSVRALALAPPDAEGRRRLIVGSDDASIRILAGNQVETEVTEVDAVTHLASLAGESFAYALSNGTVGAYDGANRAWRVKSKHRVTALGAFDLDGDGVPEIVTGWSGGKIEVRDPTSGAIVYKDTFGDAVSAVLGAEYLGDGGGGDMLVCGLDGEVRGYRSREAGWTATTSAMSRLDVSAGGGGEARSGMAAEEMMGKDRHEETLVELNQRRQDLLVELKSYERNSAAIEQAGFRGETATGAQIPRDTKVRSRLEMNPDVGGGELVLATNNDSVIKAAILFGEAVFEEESRFVYFPSPSTEVRVPIRPPRDVAAELSIKALVSARASPTYHVFELEFAVPRFCMYAPLTRWPEPAETPSGSVTFAIPDRVERIVAWIDEAFNTNHAETLRDARDADVRLGFLCLRDGGRLLVETDARAAEMVIRADSMEAAGDFVQEMCAKLDIDELESVVDFPDDVEAFGEVLDRVDDRNAARSRLVADVADGSNAVKTYVIKAEDARILGDMNAMRRMYGQLFDLNRELIMQHAKRAQNHEELLAALKEVNQMIQRAAKCRHGAAKTRTVAACRKAIKENNTHALFDIIAHGARGSE